MHLKIIGSDCSNGLKILKNIKKAEKNLSMKIDVEEVPISAKEKYNIKYNTILKIRKCGYFEYAGSMVTICDHKSALRVEGSGEVEFQGKVIASGLPKGKVEALTSYRTIGMIAADGGEGNQGWYRLRVYLG